MRLARFLATLTILLPLLAACAPTPTPQTLVTITFAIHDYQRDHYAARVKEFHKAHPEITVNLVSTDEITGQPSGVASSDDVLKIAAAADTFLYSAIFPEQTALQGAILDLSDLAEGDKGFTADDFYAGPLSLCRSGGKLWCLPYVAETWLIYYSPKLFDTAGVPYPQTGWSWDDFLEAARRTTTREGDQVKQWGYVDAWPFYTLPVLAEQKVDRLVDYQQTPPRVQLDQTGVGEALRWYADLVLQHGVMPNPATTDQAALSRIPYDGAAAMWVGRSGEADNFRACCDARVVPFPEAGDAATTLSAWGYFVSAGTSQPQAAWRWVEWLTRQPPDPRMHDMPARKSAAQKAQYWKSVGAETAAVFQYTLEHAAHYPGAVHGALRRAYESVLRGESVEVATAAAQADAMRRLSQEAAESQGPPAKAIVPPSGQKPGAATTIRFHARPGADLTAWRALAGRFQTLHPDIAVDIGNNQSLDLAEEAARADCFAGIPYLLGSADTEAVLPLDPFLGVAKPGLEAIVPAILETARAGGRLWALPLEADATFLYYNPALFDAAGAPYPAQDWTPQQLMEEAIALANVQSPSPTVGFYLPSGAIISAPAYLAWLGGKAFNADGQPTFDDPATVAALAQYVAFINKAMPLSSEKPDGIYFDGISSESSNEPPVLIRSGRVAMWPQSYSDHRFLAPLAYEVGVAPLPAGARALSQIVPWALFISAQTEHRDACWAWLSFVSGEPEAVSLLPVRRDVAASEAWRKEVGAATAAAWHAILERGEVSSGLSLGLDAGRETYWLYQAVAEALAGEAPATALAQAQKKAMAYTTCLAGRGAATEEAVRACARQADPGVKFGNE
ncbi:MAG: extracellular solute-binding protein [Anaerolineae bacterium]|nr:extracellular solute-binding protein [Anaerolineae bacterium]